MSTTTSKAITLPKKPIAGPGLTVPGVVILQFLIIFLFEAFEFSFTKVGLFTGIAILVAIGGGLYLGRTGTSLAVAVNPPLAFFFSTILLMVTIGGVGLHVTKIGLDLVTSLSAVAPYLITGAAFAWIAHFTLSLRNRPSRLQTESAQ
jgi:hypothetical protein